MRQFARSMVVILASSVLMLVFFPIVGITGYFQQPTGNIIFKGKSVELIEWDPQANLIAVLLRHTREIAIIDTMTGEEVEILGDALTELWESISVAWSPDGTALASLEDKSIVRLWDLETGKNISYISIKEETGDWGYPEKGSLAWSPDGDRIAVTDGYENLLIWDIMIDEVLIIPTMLTPWGAATGVVWSPDGSKIAVVDEGTKIEITDAATLQHISLLPRDPSIEWGSTMGNYGQLLEWTLDGQHIVTFHSRGSGGNFIFIRDATTGEVLETLTDFDDPVLAIALSSDGTKLASGHGSWYNDAKGDNTVRIWDMETYEELYVLERHTDYVTTVAWSPDSSQVASGSADGTIRIWQIEPSPDASE